MAKPKSTTRILTRSFERAAQPVYIVDAEGVVVFANPACADWTGVEPSDLLGSKCVYTSHSRLPGRDNSPTSRTNGLCPNPELLSADEENEPDSARHATHFVYALSDGGIKIWRAAAMERLADADSNHIGVLVVCQAQTCKGPTSRSATSELSKQLHNLLAESRQTMDSMYSLESLVGTSPYAIRMRRQVNMAVETHSDLLVVGPTGSGKEHLVRTIHSTRNASLPEPRRSELIPIHCSIADQHLIQQNIKDVIGSRTQSHKHDVVDWLMLLDVDQLGESAQNELLGFFSLPNFSLRTLTTCSQPLVELSKSGTYSPELAHFLSTITIELSPLSDRLKDIPLLAQALLERDNFRREKQLSGFSDEVLNQFAEFNWPENLDQLNRTILSAAENCKSNTIQTDDLPDDFLNAVKAMRVGSFVETKIKLDDYLASIEKELVIRALKQSKGNRTKAAKLLGISRPKLLRRIGFFELDPTNPEDDQIDPSAFVELE